MSQQQSYIALDWVKEALDETLLSARYIVQQAPQDLSALLPLLHQVSGTLHMTQLAEPLALAETLEHIAHAVVEGKVERHILPELLLGLDLLRDELLQMQRTKRGHSIAIYRMVNHFRPLLSRDPLKQREWLKPDLSLVLGHQWLADPLGKQNRAQLARVMRAHLVRILAKQGSTEDWQAIVLVADYMSSGAGTLQQAALWHVAHALFTELAIVDHPKTAPLELDYLLVRLERLLSHGLDDETVLADCLLQLGQLENVETLEAKRLRQVFGLESLFEAGMTPRLLDTVLSTIERAMQVLLQNPASAQVSLQEAERLLNIAGWSNFALQIETISQSLTLALSQNRLQVLMHDLTDLHQRLTETVVLVSAAHDQPQDVLNDARHAAVRESRSALESAKEAISNYHANQLDAVALATLPEHLSQVRGVFTILGLERPAEVLDRLTSVVTQTVLQEGFTPNWRQVGLLAESISAIEYYLDQLASHYQDDRILDQAEQALNLFEQPLTTVEPASAGGAKIYHDETPLTVLDEEPVAPVSALSVAAAQIELPEDDFGQDEEIRDIFIEEAQEVLESILAFFPQWAEDFSNIAALKEFRRAFHTLKGSGRMVGARVVGELAWSIENLLNRVLDQTIVAHSEIVDLIQDVIDVIPVLVQDYANGQPASRDPRAYIAHAQALLKGELRETVSAKPVVTPEIPVEPVSVERQAEAVDAAFVVKQQNLPQTVSSVPELPAMPADDFSQDDEIREIFVEEAQEVLEHIREHFPLWSTDFSNTAALKEFRRGFHTLKGSGRMVGARVVGELAWSIENMLNRVLDGAVSPDENMIHLIDDVLAVVPVLVEDFNASQPASFMTSELMFWANERAAGRFFEPHQEALDDSLQSLASGWEDAREVPAAAVAEANSPQAEPDLPDLPDAFDALADALTTEFAVAQSDEPAATQEKQQVEASYIDPQLLEIFVSEAEGYIQDIQNFIKHYPEPAEVTDVLLRAVHTLRGSAGMTGIDPIYRLAMAMESECKRLMREHLPMLPLHIELLEQMLVQVQLHLAEVQTQQRSSTLNTADLALMDRILTIERQSDDSSTGDQSVVGLVSQLMTLEIDDLLDAEWELESQFSAEQPADYVARMAAQSGELAKATASLPVPALAQLAALLHRVYLHVVDEIAQTKNSELIELLGNGHAALTRMFDAMAGSQKVPAETEILQALSDWLTAYTDAHAVSEVLSNAASSPSQQELDTHNDPELLDIFLEEAEELVQSIDQQFEEWAAMPTATSPLMALQRHLHTLKGGARMARVESVGDFGHELETVYEQLVSGRLVADAALIRFMRHAQDQIARQIEQLVAQRQSFFCHAELAVLRQFLVTQNTQVFNDFFSTAVVGSISTPVAAVSPDLTVSTPIPTPVLVETAKPALRQMHVLAQAWDEGSAPDPDMLEIFLDEAAEIIDQTSTQLATWLADPQRDDQLKELQRGLHTLKGGARMAGVESLGDLAHEMEFVYEDLALGRKPKTELIGRLLAQCHDWLADAVVVLDRGEKPVYPTPLVEALQLFMKHPEQLIALPTIVTQEIAHTAELEPRAEPAQGLVTASDASYELPPMQGLFQAQSGADQSSNEMIRVSSSLMEKLINLSGESAINRARIEMDTTTVGLVLEEMGSTVQRLVEQLRRMEGELESQILARHQGEMGKYDDFDPLEMDQYSALNQLSKSLYESASDLFDFKATLLDKVRDTESLLLQQSRLQSELQEGLMKSRLVPFSRLAPRLQRIVRQTATELGKPAELIIQNAEGELDRTILERIVAPLEHMLRNAVDHGLETPEQRKAAHKPSVGKIVLSVVREGGEIVLTLQDDGRGINVDAVRRKAVERGLLAADAQISDVEVMQFVFHAGLSTAQSVTQISGRGVGMDVVQSEIKLLGGSVSVDSIAGQGSTFSLRLPLTVSVTDALMVRVADRVFAVPLTQIDRIVRVSPTELSTLYQTFDSQYAFEGNVYRLRYLGEFIQGTRVPTLDGQAITVPVLLVRQAGQLLAIQVDQLIGSRVEIVVKPVGQQLASIAAVSGATILGDGSVTVILDIVALARQAASNLRREKSVSAADQQQAQTTIMVVDDSVTVRKVTTRLLERYGYAVLTAKDGVDAIAKLEEVVPDLMLLDIEMPRMDGFEVANLIRHNPRVKDLPIIMITSRTGEKHRERAFQIGVNCYMGKPFQEQELLENIHELLGVTSE